MDRRTPSPRVTLAVMTITRGSTMTRHLLFAIILIGTGVLISPAAAVIAVPCEDQAVDCGARCTDVTGGAGDLRGHQNKCINRCARQVNRCLANLHARAFRGLMP